MWRIPALVVLALVVVEASVGEQWASYKLAHGKKYSGGEEAMRFSLWEANRKMVEEHNAGDHGWTMALTESSDWTTEEFEERMMGYKPPKDLGNVETVHFEPMSGQPSHVDHRESGLVTPVKNQGHCGSCWAFSATGAMEGMWKLKRGELISMSEQNLVDCAPGSCDGGWMYNAWNYAKNGIESEQTYPYEGVDGHCRYNNNNRVAWDSGYRQVSSSESSLMTSIYTVGHPISVAIHVGSSFQHYTGGVYSDPSCQNGQVNHAVLLVGYENTGTEHYWIVKNSWGASWGEGGYIRMKIGENSCAITSNAMYPIL